MAGELNVIVLGCGPAGLMAAHAAAMFECNVKIFSKPRKSFMKGAQYLHRPIPLASKKPEFEISYDLWGTSEGYRDKVYGPGSSVEVSPVTLSTKHSAWDIREAYDWLWDTYGSYVQEWEVVDADVSLTPMISRLNPDLVISTIPAYLLCKGGHAFSSTSIWSTDQSFHTRLGEENRVVCNGVSDTGWYRSSWIQGWGNTEWPHDRKPPLSSERLWEVVKPIGTTCDCYPGVVREGRYGSWRKGVLAHEAYYNTAKLLGDVICGPTRT